MKALVTGGLGFIGSHLVDRLLAENWEVFVVDTSSNTKNLNQHKANKKLTIHKKDINDDLSKFFDDGVDFVFHLAAIPLVQYSIREPLKTHQVNATGTLNLLELSRKYNVKKFVLSSSCAVYGDAPTPQKETMEPKPLSPYGMQKLVSEQYCKLFSQIYGLDTISLRYFNVYGPRQDASKEYACVIPKFITLVNQNKSPTIFGDGTHTRDYVFVKDVVEANWLAATKKEKLNGEVVNIGSGKNTPVNELAKTIIGDKKIKPIHSDPIIEPKDARAYITKAKKLLGWEPKYSLEQGLKETVEFFTQT
ncbi:MAG: NAD-dependent epimerase/dehydratase family protein [Candidatus Aenigmarchaeota archaeon]|nr:NAD-dependent epimerase/dehydratase family protein [Candidatus Aenigmarchaeota archaeon]